MTPRARFRYVLAHRRAGRFGPRVFPGLRSANKSLVPCLASIMFGEFYVSEQHCDIEGPRLKPEWTYTFTPYGLSLLEWEEI